MDMQNENPRVAALGVSFWASIVYHRLEKGDWKFTSDYVF